MIGTTITGGGWGPGAQQYRTGFGGGLGPLPPQIQRQLDAQRRQQQVGQGQQTPNPGTPQGGAVTPPRGDLANYMNQYYGQPGFISGDMAASKADYDQWKAGQAAQQAEQEAANRPPATNSGAPPGTIPFHPQPNQSALMQQFRRMYGGPFAGARTQDQFHQRSASPYGF